MENFLFLLTGVLLGLVIDKTYLINMRKYFASPIDQKTIELNWSVSQLLKLFNAAAADRWYESRQHTNSGLLLSIASTLGLVYAIRVSFMHDSGDSGRSTTLIRHGFQSLESLKKNHVDLIKCATVKLKLAEDHNYYYYDTFIAGHNVVDTFMDSH